MALPPTVPRKLPLIPVRMDQFARVHLNGAVYTKPTFRGDQCILVREDGLSESFEQTEIKSLFDSGKLRIDAHYYDPVESITKAEAGSILFRDLSREEQDLVLSRQGYCNHILKEIAHHNARRSGPRFEKAIDDHFMSVYRALVAKQKGKSGTTVTLPRKPSVHQVSRWLERYEESNFDPLSLADRRPRKSGYKTPRLDSEVQRLLKEAASQWLSTNRPSKKFVFNDFFRPSLKDENRRRATEGKAPLPEPNIKAFHRAINRLNYSHVLTGRHTAEYARKKLTITHTGLTARYPLERVEMDEWLVPLQILLEWSGVYEKLSLKEKEAVKRIRIWMTVAICCATRCILSFVMHVGSPNTQSALQALKLIFQDKTAIGREFGTESTWAYYGRPVLICTDNGSALISSEFHAAIIAMRCRFDHTPPSEPNLRGRIESAFRKIELRLLPHFTGRTFSNPTERGDYDAEANASLTYDELLKVMAVYMVDVYHHEPHEMLLGETPFNAWNRLTENWGVDTLIDKNEIRHVFGVRKTTAITSDGIEFMGLHYQSDTLQRDRFKHSVLEAECSIDTEDLTQISVFLRSGAITVDCVHKEIAGVTLDQWTQALADIRHIHRREAEVAFPVVMGAVEKIKATSELAVKRSGIELPVWTPEALAKAEDDLLRTLKIAKRPDPAQHGLFGNVVELEIDSDEPEDSTEDEYADDPTPSRGRKMRSPTLKSAAKGAGKKNMKSEIHQTQHSANPTRGFKKWETEE